MIVKSVAKVSLEDGEYHGIWEGLNVGVNGNVFKVGRASKTKVGCLVTVENGIASVNSEGRGLTKDEAEQVFAEIDNEGLGYWASNYGFKDTEADPKLAALCSKAKAAMDELESHLKDVFNKYDIG